MTRGCTACFRARQPVAAVIIGCLMSSRTLHAASRGPAVLTSVVFSLDSLATTASSSWTSLRRPFHLARAASLTGLYLQAACRRVCCVLVIPCHLCYDALVVHSCAVVLAGERVFTRDGELLLDGLGNDHGCIYLRCGSKRAITG